MSLEYCTMYFVKTRVSIVQIEVTSIYHPLICDLSYDQLVPAPMNCNKFYCNLTFYKLNTYLILTSACLVLWSKNVSTDKNFLRNILVTRGDPFVCACPRLRSSRCRQTIVESSSLYFWSPENKLCGEVGWVYPCEDKVSI